MSKDSNYVYSGHNTNVDKNNLKSVRHFDFKTHVNKDESIEVKMIEGDSTHTFLVTKEAISGFYHDHPIHNRYTTCNEYGAFKRSQNSICCQSFGGSQLIKLSGTSETITAVYRDAPGDWQFIAASNDTDVINFAYGNEIRYCAFIEAFSQALIDGSRGGVYEWLYKAVCYSVA